MTDNAISRSRWLDTERISLSLPDGSTTEVEEGAQVRIGDPIARFPLPPVVIAYADELRVTMEASANEIANFDGKDLHTGDLIGSRRSGLRTHALRAPANGTAQVVSGLGVLVLRRPNAEAQVVATATGVVLQVTAHEIVIASAVERVRFAFAVGGDTLGGHSLSPGLPRVAARSQTARNGNQRTNVTTIPHIGDIAQLLSEAKARPGARVVGTVSEDVAWKLLSEQGQAIARTLATSPIIVLDGVGSPKVGKIAIQSLGNVADSRIVIDHRERCLTIYRDAVTPVPKQDGLSEKRQSHARLREPARWNAACQMLGLPFLSALTSGVRTPVVRTQSTEAGTADIPLQNISVDDELP